MKCWTWDIDPILLDIYGPLKIRWYGVCFLFVFLVGFWLLHWQFKRSGRDPEIAVDFIYWGFGGVLLGSWFGHRFFYEFDRVIRNPFYLFDISGGLAGLASHGATIGLLTALFLFARKQRIPLGEMIDRFMFSAATGAIFVRTGNLLNSEIIGRPVADAWWAICMPRVDNPLLSRHPSQLYEIANGFLVLGLLLLVDRLAGREKRPNWLLAGTFFCSYFFLRFFVEFFKAHQSLNTGLTMGQYLSIPFFLLGATMLYLSRRDRRPTSVVGAEMTAKFATPVRRVEKKAGKKKKRKKR